jgi:hypothetical protein
VNPEERPVPIPFDEVRALEELETLRAQIVEARAARGRVEDEFEAFVRGFRSKRQREVTADAPDDVPASPEPRSDAGSAVGAPIGAEAGVPDTAPAVTVAVARPVPVRRRNTRGAVVITLAAVVVLGAAAALAVRGRRAGPIPPEAARPAAIATAQSDPTAAEPVAQTETAPPQTGVNVEMTTRRRVWVRVTIDGRRGFERECAADERIPLHADRTILIRAGDAGAVALTRDGRDAGLLGRDGMVASREFTAGTPVR